MSDLVSEKVQNLSYLLADGPSCVSMVHTSIDDDDDDDDVVGSRFFLSSFLLCGVMGAR